MAVPYAFVCVSFVVAARSVLRMRRPARPMMGWIMSAAKKMDTTSLGDTYYRSLAGTRLQFEDRPTAPAICIARGDASAFVMQGVFGQPWACLVDPVSPLIFTIEACPRPRRSPTCGCHAGRPTARLHRAHVVQQDTGDRWLQD